ncbi:MAG: DMT family transporter [Bacteroidota bacterium]|nr:DMT family transporter [Bacteroidota bacterium]
MNNKVKGYLSGIVAAIAYGTNPLGALFLYREGYNATSVIFFRFVFAVLILGIILIAQKESFRLSKFEFKVLGSLGVIFAASALTLYSSFNFMDSGIASTILFTYPIFVAIIMSVCFKERMSFISVFAIVVSFFGISLLYKGEGGVSLSTIGIILVLISSLTYSIYIVLVNRAKIEMNPFKMTFYIMAIAGLCIFVYSLFGKENHIIAINSFYSLWWFVFLGVVPTIIAMTFLNIAIPKIGSVPTAIMGALEPATAVIISVVVFDGIMSARLLTGIFLILIAVTLITLKDLPIFHKKT